jgi:tetratricopeptide (TPR) repeat protein
MNNAFEELLERYERSLLTGQPTYLDVSEVLHLSSFYSLEVAQFDKAKELVHYGLMLHPDAMLLKVEQALVYLQANELDNARPAIEALGPLEASSPYAMLPRGVLYLKNERLNEALAIFRDACEQVDNPYILPLTYHIGKFLMDARQFKAAKKYFRLYLRHNPAKDEVLFYLGCCHSMLNEMSEAIKAYDKVLKTSPYAQSAWLNLGQVHAELKQFDKAIEAYSFALAIHEDDVYALAGRGEALYQTREYRKALEDFQEVEKLFPEHPQVYLRLGDCNRSLGKLEVAIEAYRKYIDTRPGANARLYAEEQCAICLYHLKCYEESIPYLKVLTKVRPSALYWNLLGSAQSNNNQPEDAIQSLTQSLAIDPKQPEALKVMGIAYRMRGDYPKAQKYLKRAYALNRTGSPWIPFNLAVLYYKMGEYDEARKFLEEAILKDKPDDIILWFADDCQEVKDDPEFFRPMGYSVTFERKQDTDPNGEE